MNIVATRELPDVCLFSRKFCMYSVNNQLFIYYILLTFVVAGQKKDCVTHQPTGRLDGRSSNGVGRPRKCGCEYHRGTNRQRKYVMLYFVTYCTPFD